MKRLYLAGAMTNLSDSDFPLEWRNEMEETLKEFFKVVNPAAHFFLYPEVTQREAMEWDLFQVRNSDVIIVNFTNCATSLGTQHELAIASELRIPIIGLNESNERLHPWSKLVCRRIFRNKLDLYDYVIFHYSK